MKINLIFVFNDYTELKIEIKNAIYNSIKNEISTKLTKYFNIKCCWEKLDNLNKWRDSIM